MPLNAQDLIDKGVPKNIAQGFISTNAAALGVGNQEDLAKAMVQTQSEAEVKSLYPAEPGGSGDGGNGGGGGSGGGTDPGGPPPIDWKSYLEDWGFTSDMIDEFNRLAKVYAGDSADFRAAALAYIRGTDWYKTMFPGIQAGEKLGLFGDEAGYRSYVNSVNQVWRRYNGADISTNDLLGYLQRGWDASQIGMHLNGQSLLSTQKGDLRSLIGAFDNNGQLTDSQLADYGDYLGGLGNTIGPELQRRIDLARQRMASIFQGTLATPSLSITNGRITSGGQGSNVDVGA